LPTGGRGDDAGEIPRILHLAVVEAHDHVADLKPCGLRRTALVDAGHQRAARTAEVERLGGGLVDVLDADAEPAAARLAELAELVDDGHRGRGGHREADADGAAGRRQDRRVDADHLAGHVEQGTARVALVDGGVRLDVVVVGAALDVAAAGRDDAGGDGEAEAERVADRHHPVARTHLLRVAETDRFQRRVALHPQHGEIDLRVLADHVGLQPLPVRPDDVDLVGVADDVVVGDHDAGRVDHEA
jgi:hypothetical protein